MTDIEYIASRHTEGDLLCQLAEEASELAQAALKLRRTITQRSRAGREEVTTMSIVLFAIIGATIGAGVGYWICFGIYCAWALVRLVINITDSLRKGRYHK